MDDNQIENIKKTMIVKDGQVFATSREVAMTFGKKHKNVLRDIQVMEIPDEWRGLNFEPSSYINAQNKQQPMVEMTRDGFTILAMGFTGKAAMRFKLAYIEAFKQMEKALQAQQAVPTLPDRPQPIAMPPWQTGYEPLAIWHRNQVAIMNYPAYELIKHGGHEAFRYAIEAMGGAPLSAQERESRKLKFALLDAKPQWGSIHIYKVLGLRNWEIGKIMELTPRQVQTEVRKMNSGQPPVNISPGGGNQAALSSLLTPHS
jgi:Rha family phage regulatory protein